ncbi:MarR-type transcriptional regulator [Bifidobacterium actinocoloniiforme DSM 22766]|uniref:MarR-type transcriptional regulator n=1 Tax=Bifidobacterium actinocoloniiforme DSM 22766 TaxID=1437605 RepID=A0A086Z268_9BIFI|nr:MarR family transcriptional regulator [Bifidobacterium actinocoloniiforme]AKV55965.1 hypothetical protein AB656_07255 [Bifidobacterium actinocoloniiforme DSM 22766]KFI40618.1 MarR-type transcriptional regulator [Bifidobacterium actinocoloniiforme DSM 22766]
MSYAEEAFDELSRLVMEHRAVVPEKVDRSIRGEAVILRALEKFGRLTPSQLCKVARLSSGRVSSLLRSLEGKGCVSRTADDEDRRNVHVSITEVGRERNRQAYGMMRRDICWVFGQMGQAQASEFLRLCALFDRYVAERCESRISQAGRRRPVP